MATKAKLVEFMAAGLSDTVGLPLSGYKIRTYASDGTTAKVVWEDRDKTLPTAAGKSAFTLDSTGRAVVYGDGVYVIKIWASTADPDVDNPYKSYPATNYWDGDDETVFSGVTLAGLKAITGQSVGDIATMKWRTTAGDGAHGDFRWDSSNLSASVSADTQSGVYVAPDSDPTGASGAWVRQYHGGVNVKWYGAIGNGVADDTAAFTSAAATSKPIDIPYGDFVLSTPVTISAAMIGSGADDGQTTITLTGTGQLVVGDSNAVWENFFIRSAVNSLAFIRVPGVSYFSCTHFRAEKVGAATGQIAIQFDTTIASVYFANIDNFKIKLDYPFDITGDSTQVFNANKIGTVATAYYQDFQSAVTIDGVLACDANQFAGYFETGTNAINHVAGALRQNRFKMVIDTVNRVYNTGVTVTDQNLWEILSGGFIVNGTYPQNQIIVGAPSTRVRATNATADSIPNAAATILKFDTEVYDSLTEFVSATGVFTAKNAGYYMVSACALSASAAWDAGERWEIAVYKNGSEYSRGDSVTADAATTRQRLARVCTSVFLNGTTDTITVRLIHNQGAAVALDTAPTANYIDINRIL